MPFYFRDLFGSSKKLIWKKKKIPQIKHLGSVVQRLSGRLCQGCLKLEPQGGFEGKAASGMVSGLSSGTEGRVTRVWVNEGKWLLWDPEIAGVARQGSLCPLAWGFLLETFSFGGGRAPTHPLELTVNLTGH